jgi:hypothetical protein
MTWGGRYLALGLALAAVLAGCRGGHHQSGTAGPGSGAATCPLTDLPGPNGKVPQRPALAVKVDNLPAARPPYGLGAADVVYEQPVEGGITRFIVIYQCHDAPRIEPVRSARLMDPDLVRQYGAHPLFAYAGAVPPVVAKIDASPLIDVGVYRAPSAYHRDSARQAPHNLVSSTSALYTAGSAQHASTAPPAPVFQYGPLPDHRAATSVHIAFPSSDLTWTWQSQGGKWTRSYSDTGPATLADGGQIAAANVIVMRLTPALAVTGSGAAQVFRNGAVMDGTWRRSSLSDLTELVDGAGQSIPLTPGQTWIELVPTTVNVTVTP